MSILDQAAKNQKAAMYDELVKKQELGNAYKQGNENATKSIMDGLANLFKPVGNVYNSNMDAVGVAAERAATEQMMRDRGYSKVPTQVVQPQTPRSAFLDLPVTVGNDGTPTYIQDSGGF